MLILEIVGGNWEKAEVEAWLIFYTRALIIPRRRTARNIPLEPECHTGTAALPLSARLITPLPQLREALWTRKAQIWP